VWTSTQLTNTDTALRVQQTVNRATITMTRLRISAVSAKKDFDSLIKRKTFFCTVWLKMKSSSTNAYPAKMEKNVSSVDTNSNKTTKTSAYFESLTNSLSNKSCSISKLSYPFVYFTSLTTCTFTLVLEVTDTSSFRCSLPSLILSATYYSSLQFNRHRGFTGYACLGLSVLLLSTLLLQFIFYSRTLTSTGMNNSLMNSRRSLMPKFINLLKKHQNINAEKHSMPSSSYITTFFIKCSLYSI
jgi:hypothetical protein